MTSVVSHWLRITLETLGCMSSVFFVVVVVVVCFVLSKVNKGTRSFISKPCFHASFVT